MIVGIDLGTTNSLVACFRDGKAEIIPNRLGKRATPSVVSVDDNKVVYVGETAKERSIKHPLETAKVFKRSMGTDREFVLNGKHFRPEELSALILKSLKEDAEAYLGENVTETIISVPAYFNDQQRKATKLAGEIAGFEVKRIINEPTAAALAFGMDNKGKDLRYLVFDLGGGTFDVSILELHDFIMEVHAIAGDNHIGGENFTSLLANIYLERAAVVPESLDISTMNRLMKAAEEWKCLLTDNDKVLMNFTINGQNFETQITESDFEKACEPLLEKLRHPIERSLRDSKMSLKDIDQIVLVGGATKMPIIRKFVMKLFQRFPGILVDPDEAVAIGAALQCGIRNREEEISEIVLTDVCPFTLGTEVMMDNGMFEESGHYLPIIERNTVIPVSRTHRVCTAYDMQERISVKILQGESRMAYNNLQLGVITVPVPPGPKGKETIDITFTYDVNSLLEAEVYVLSTGVKRKILIQGDKNVMTDEEAKARMEQLQYLKLSPRNEEVNQLVLFRGERLYEECSGEDREAINQGLMEFERTLSKQDKYEIEKSRNKLTELLDKIEFQE